MGAGITIPERVALVGLGPDWELHASAEAAIAPPTQVWGVNSANMRCRVDVLFNMHDIAYWDRVYAARKAGDYDAAAYRASRLSLDAARDAGIPVITCAANPRWPNMIPYPIETIIKAAGIDYFTCTVAYMLAFAIFTGVKRVDMYGINGTEDYAHQHPCIAYWIGRGHGHGVEIYSHGSASELLRTEPWQDSPVQKQWRYGYAEEPEMAKGLLAELQQQMEGAEVGEAGA